MKIVLAPDSFKGSLSAAEAARAMAAGVREASPDAAPVLLPVADGGEGTAEALVAATGGRLVPARVSGPLGLPVDAAFGLLGPDGGTAVVEAASAAGLTLVPRDRRDPGAATTYGVGELIRRAAESGANRLIVGLGGTATNDGGAGALQALGLRFFDDRGRLLPAPLAGRDLGRVARVEADGLCVPAGVEVVLATDVTSPLLGPRGASRVFGPQKGADAASVDELERAMARWAARLPAHVPDRPGAGAAGGLGAGLMAFLGAEARGGIDLVLDAVGFEAHLDGADWVWTGEGRIDSQTLAGKTVAGVLRRARARGVPVLAFGGSVEAHAARALAGAGLVAAFPLVSGPMTLDEAVRDAAPLLSQAAARVASLLQARREAARNFSRAPVSDHK